MQKTKPSPKRRWLTACLWSIAGILLLGVLAATVLNIVDWHMRKTSTQDSTYPLGGTTVSLTHFAVGNIRIVAGATDTVTVHSTVKQGIHKLGLAAQHTATGLTIRQTGSCDTSYGLLSPCSASYVLTVPTDTTLIADTSDVTLSVTGVHGNHQLSVNDGNLTVTNIVAQRLSLHANDGTLIAQNVRANVVDARDNDGTMRLQLLGSPAQVTARGNDGDITITLEKNATAYRTTVTANDGTARQAIKTDPDAADHVVTATVNDGNVTVSY